MSALAVQNPASVAAPSPKTGTAPSGAEQFLTFTIGKEEYAVDIMSVREIKGWEDTTRLPNCPEYMRGVMNLRGVIVPIFDLRARFNQGITQADKKNVVIILAINSEGKEEKIIGILVDTVSDILNASGNDIKPAPTSDYSIDSNYISGLISVEERMVVVLNSHNLFSGETIEKAEQIVQ